MKKRLTQVMEKETFTLHIDDHKEEPPKKPTEKKKEEEAEPKGGLSERIWSTLRFISTAATIFIVLFFVMNWNAYSAIILNKLGLYKPANEIVDPLDENLLKLPTNGDTQDLLDLSKDPEIQKTQIPPLTLAVTPPDDRIVIPRISKNVPIVTISTEALINRDWGRLEQEIQDALQNGVVHYPGTAFPGEKGNVVITGHSSYFVWDPGRFKDVFALLHDVGVGDKIYVYHDQQRYEYEVYETKVVLPTQVDVLLQEGDDKLTLITCTPVGTNLKRLIVTAKPVETSS